MAGRSRTKFDCLDVLSGDEAAAVLRHLLSSHRELLPAARQAANALLATVSSTDTARSVFEALIALDLDDLAAGPRAAGYVEPSEGAWGAIVNVTAPYFRDLERRVKLRHESEASELRKGIVLGLYRAEQRGFELLEYAEDGPSELASQAVAIWQRRRRHVSFRVRSLRSSLQSGIRTLEPLLLSVTYRFHIAGNARNAGDAVDHCTPLHAS